MSRIQLQAKLALAASALWWASLSCLGAWIVPSLFSYAPSKALAGNLAAHLFSGQTWLTLACGLCLLAISNASPAPAILNWLKNTQKSIIAGMLCAFLVEFLVAPKIVARESLMIWHSVGTAMFVIQWICASWVFFKTPLSLEISQS